MISQVCLIKKDGYLSLNRKYAINEATINPVVIAPISGVAPKPAVAKKKTMQRRKQTFWIAFVLPCSRSEPLINLIII